jgi:hypothetical protein
MTISWTNAREHSRADQGTTITEGLIGSRLGGHFEFRIETTASAV